MSVKLKENLERLMQEKKLTLTQLSKLAGVPKSSLHGYITTRSSVTKLNIIQVKKIADALQVDLHELLFSLPDPHASIHGEILKELFSGDIRVTLHRIERKNKSK